MTDEYPDSVQIVFKHLPLSFHKHAQDAAEAAEAAHQQGKFWQMHDKIFSQQRSMSAAKFVEYAQEIGLDMERYRKDLKSDVVQGRINGDTKEASSLGVTGTPGFFINGRFLSGARPYGDFKTMIDRELGKG
ncbi:MAG: DsbA family protein [Myxococcales bacterium]|nr:DsbA family protein [Myxococcales bacterium]MCH7866442.1 DsbA family protein [Myxococcales bacterium]